MGVLKKTKILIVILLILNLLVVGGYWFFTSAINKNNEIVSDLSQELDLQIAKERQLRSFKKILAETKEKREALDSYFIPAADIVSFIQEVEALSALSGIEIEIGSVDVREFLEDETSSDRLEFLDISMTTEGSWSGSFRFLELLENMPYLIALNKFALDAKQNTEGETLYWEGALGLRVLKLKK
ncbi:hypothetical protein COV42_00160 [Candidatus Campbellbacteria bacterium CG11_big_fil_rev_8_21_14_0_20_44_21]|uniref:Type 4a pilus biogenesis protein PilO n=1 Tax=Candidatus Campbellbacteria bacterium CG22_combo_CG10-13_8_21_14_all_43_18 TaxID=1974530 RepID=A0A2H0DY62_9BACT|nr:MAG: hypothetical protein COW82_00955 [Candidatus Campbellbacteria bacterium CG22_combo_CG10-13_8_21_14_all_43_18]PIR24552.1 MAG: hypothetical protein COV42_00160 [Candidatus Campbellbacteria bacterium CG11_big_fil_rev_8_21_14_0_20_44_21]